MWGTNDHIFDKRNFEIFFEKNLTMVMFGASSGGQTFSPSYEITKNNVEKRYTEIFPSFTIGKCLLCYTIDIEDNLIYDTPYTVIWKMGAELLVNDRRNELFAHRAG